MERQSKETTEQWLARLLGVDMLLWSPNVQREAFLHLERIFATRPIKHGATPSELIDVGEPLRIEYTDYGKACSVDDLMRDEHLSGLIIVKDNKVFLERYAMGLARDARWQSSSMVKSIASTLVGAAVHDGLIRSLDDRITAYLPYFSGSAYDKVTIRHLLTMSSGTNWVEDYNDLNSDVNRHYIKPIAERRPGYIANHLKTLKSIYEPGTQFYYNTGDVFILSLLLTKVTGATVADYCSEKIWRPAGMEQDGYFILDSDSGQEITGSRASALLRDYARFGLFMVHDGVVGGQRVLPQGWVREATTPSAPRFDSRFADERPGVRPNEFIGYGYLWWVREEGRFMALGSSGQWIYVEPARGLVIVIVGAMPREAYMDAGDPAARQQGALGGPRRFAFIEAVRKALE